MIKYVFKMKLIILFILILSQSIYAKGWKQDGKGFRYENSDGSYVTNSYRNSGNHKMYLDENGYVATLYYLEDGEKAYFFDKDGYKMKYGCVIIGPTTKANKAIDNDYVLYFSFDGSVISKTLLSNDNMPSNYIESRQEYLK